VATSLKNETEVWGLNLDLRGYFFRLCGNLVKK
jgi:hypothetical protein